MRCRWIGEWGSEHIRRGDQEVESGRGVREKELWWARDFEEIRQSALFRDTTGTETKTSNQHLSNHMQTSGT